MVAKSSDDMILEWLKLLESTEATCEKWTDHSGFDGKEYDLAVNICAVIHNSVTAMRDLFMNPTVYFTGDKDDQD